MQESYVEQGARGTESAPPPARLRVGIVQPVERKGSSPEGAALLCGRVHAGTGLAAPDRGKRLKVAERALDPEAVGRVRVGQDAGLATASEGGREGGQL
jgi:hypothetical protein